MQVILCEDNEKILQQIATYIENYAMIEDNSIKIVLKSPDSSEVLSYIQSNRADCYFLDIDLGTKVTGIEIAKQIRELDPTASIIFVTTHSEMLRLTFTYRVEAMDFIIKDNISDLKHNVLTALKTAYDKYTKIGKQETTRYYQIKIGEFVKNIDFQKLLYFTVSDVAHKVILYTTQGQFEFYQSLNTIEEMDESFFRIHRSYIINIKNIVEIDKKKKCVIMTNGESCPIAFRRLKALEKIIATSSHK